MLVDVKLTEYCSGVTVTVKSRIVTVKGPRGEITKPFNHKAIEIKVMDTVVQKKKGKYVRLRMWNASYKQAAAVTTFTSLIKNMTIGVTEVSNSLPSIALQSSSRSNALATTPHAAFWCVRKAPFNFFSND